jgi:hypothetical protein
MDLYVEPFEVHSVDTISKISLVLRSMDFFNSVQIAVYYYKDSGELFSHPSLPNSITIDQQEYQSWGADDQYIIDQIVSKLGVTVVPPPPTPPPNTPA